MSGLYMVDHFDINIIISKSILDSLFFIQVLGESRNTKTSVFLLEWITARLGMLAIK